MDNTVSFTQYLNSSTGYSQSLPCDLGPLFYETTYNNFFSDTNMLYKFGKDR